MIPVAISTVPSLSNAAWISVVPVPPVFLKVPVLWIRGCGLAAKRVDVVALHVEGAGVLEHARRRR